LAFPSFIVGKRSSDYTSTYISQPDETETFTIAAGLTVFNRADWYDKTIFAVDRGKITKIRFQYPNREFTVERISAAEDEEEKWQGTLPYKFSVSTEKIDPILNIMASLTAVQIPEQDFTVTGLEKNLP